MTTDPQSPIPDLSEQVRAFLAQQRYPFSGEDLMYGPAPSYNELNLTELARAYLAQADALAEREAECERLRRAVANVEELARDWRNQAWANDAAGAPKSAADKAISPTLKVCVYRLNKAIIPAQEAQP